MSQPGNSPVPAAAAVSAAPRPPHAFRKGRAVVAGLALLLVAATLAAVFWPRSPGADVVYQQGFKALKAGRFDEALAAAKKLQDMPGGQSQSALLTGGLLVARGDAAQSLSSLETALESEQTKLPASLLLAEAYYHLGMFPQTIGSAQSALAIAPDSMEARRWLASAYYDLGDNAQAEEQLLLIAQASPQDSGPCRLLGLMYKDSERFPEAATWLREALQRNPAAKDLAETQLDLAEVLLKQHDYKAALEVLNTTEPGARQLAYLAEAQFALGEFDEARASATAALKRDAHVSGARLLLGRLELTSGSPETAVTILEQAVKEHPAQPDIFQTLAQAYQRVGRKTDADAARTEQKRLAALVTEFAEGHVTAARQPEDVPIRIRLGELAAELGRPELALVWFQAALAIDPNSPAARAGIEKLRPLQNADTRR